ncbi:kinase-like protein [Acephala macrosclerotiorum]|nr:kinase-like protein [Acephala macrosclerotiorum]
MSGPPAKLRREPSPEREKLHAQQVMSKVLTEIVLAMKRSEKPSKAYVCYDDLKQIWSEGSKISALLQPSGLSHAQIDFVKANMIIILSTLVYIGATDCLAVFRARFFKPLTSHQSHFHDARIPYLEKSKLEFLSTEPALQEQFFDNQFRFNPVAIEIHESQTTQKIHPKARLPFETRLKGVGVGGFGTVDCVKISPRYIKQPGGWYSDDVYTVACKKIIVAKDFDKEKENLQILKESLTSHVRIMLHLCTIEHGPNRYILLPYAAYGDLEVFLHCGYTAGPEPEKKYEFDNIFKGFEQNVNITFPLLAECWSLANALEWLHKEIKIDKTYDTVFCAHMDLKPANILIVPSDESVVGKWMISDFGISVFKKDTQQHDSEYGSIGDYISQVTMNTRPKRQEGTYQAPEVKLAENIFQQSSHLTPDQRGIGRKSDIWSFGCILSEVLAFSQGRDKLVIEFSKSRGQNARDNYFYDEKFTAPRQYLTTTQNPMSQPKEYVVRPAVISWLDELCTRTASPQQWIDCCVGTIKEILIPDPVKRPDATEVLELLRHVREHVNQSRLSCKIACPILGPKDEPPAPPPPTPPASPLAVGSNSSSEPREHTGRSIGPMVLRSTSFEQEAIHDPDEDDEDSDDPTGSINKELAASEMPALVDPLSFSGFASDDGPARPGAHPIQSSPLFSSFARPAEAHGIKIEQHGSVVSEPSRVVSFSLPRSAPSFSRPKIIAMALARLSNGARLACLMDSWVYLYLLNTEDASVAGPQVLPLPSSGGWKGIAISGTFVVAWGYSSQKLIFFCDTRNPQNSRSFSTEEIGMLDKVAVSEQGVAALVCRGKILTVTLQSRKTTPLYASAEDDQSFTHAAFNDTGDLLFAWAYGQTDKLYCWRSQNGVVNPRSESESPYETVKIGKPDLIRVIPYTSYQGCIVWKPDKRLFPAQIRATLRENKDPFPRNNEIALSDIQAACVFNNHSLVTAEKGILHRYLKEYKINYQGTHFLTKPAVKICGLKSSTDYLSQLLAVKDGEKIVIMICNKNATVEFVKVVPGQATPKK